MSGHNKYIKNLIACAHNNKNSHIEYLSKQFFVFSIQGPGSLKILNELIESEVLIHFSYIGSTQIHIDKLPCLIGRLDYTGERGFEII